MLLCSPPYSAFSQHKINIDPYIYTVMAKNIGTLAILSENETLLRKLLQLQMFWYSYVFLFCFFCIGTTQKNRRKVKSDTIPYRTQKMHWTKLLAPLT